MKTVDVENVLRTVSLRIVCLETTLVSSTSSH
jgi:hypothetical protein